MTTTPRGEVPTIGTPAIGVRFPSVPTAYLGESAGHRRNSGTGGEHELAREITRERPGTCGARIRRGGKWRQRLRRTDREAVDHRMITADRREAGIGDVHEASEPVGGDAEWVCASRHEGGRGLRRAELIEATIRADLVRAVERHVCVFAVGREGRRLWRRICPRHHRCLHVELAGGIDPGRGDLVAAVARDPHEQPARMDRDARRIATERGRRGRAERAVGIHLVFLDLVESTRSPHRAGCRTARARAT